MDATLERDGPRYILRMSRLFGEPPEKVWRALTSRELLRQWFPCDVKGEWTAGAELRFEFPDGEGEGLSEEDLRGEVLVADEPRLLEFRWGTQVLTFELTPEGDSCHLRLSHSFDDPAWGARNGAGWELCLENLDLLLEGAGLVKFAAKLWKSKFDHYVARFEATFGPQVGPPEHHPLLTEEVDG